MIEYEQIIKGFVNYALSIARTNDHEIEVEAKRRMEICAMCKTFRSNLWCTDCGCYLPAKTRSENMCDQNKW